MNHSAVIRSFLSTCLVRPVLRDHSSRAQFRSSAGSKGASTLAGCLTRTRAGSETAPMTRTEWFAVWNLVQISVSTVNQREFTKFTQLAWMELVGYVWQSNKDCVCWSVAWKRYFGSWYQICLTELKLQITLLRCNYMISCHQIIAM